jgi:hypothetical protein
MNVSLAASYIALPISIVCLFITIRAFYIYSLSRSDMLFVLGLSMASISLGTFIGSAGTLHLISSSWNAEWTRAFGACSGGLFIFLSSLVQSQEQLQRLRRWQIATAAVFILVILLTPLYPSFSNPWIPTFLYTCRIIIYTLALIRYVSLYQSKSTPFSFIMCLAFSLLVIGFILNLPGLFQPTHFALLTITGGIVRIFGYSTLLFAYSAS